MPREVTQFKPGNELSRGRGRPKGTPNKINATIREVCLQALDRVGGVDYMVRVAENQPQVFCALLGKILPMQVSLSDANGNPTEITVRFVGTG